VSHLPADWRAQTVALMTDPSADPAAAQLLFADDPRRSPERQLAIYREQIRLRHRRVLRGALPGLAAYEAEAFAALAEAYLREHPPDSWTLHRLADALPAWLDAHPSGDAQRDGDRADLVALDLAVGRARRAAPADPLGEVEPTTPLRLAPSARVLALRRPWHAWRRAILVDETPPHPANAPTSLVIYRRAGQVRDQVLDPTEARLLAAFATPRPLADALAEVAAAAGDPTALVAKVGPWFQRFAQRGWIARDRPS